MSMLHSNDFWVNLLEHTNLKPKVLPEEVATRPIYGGDINQAFHVKAKDAEYFVKTNTLNTAHNFQTEASSLEALADFCPGVISTGTLDHTAFLVLQYIDLTSKGDESKLGAFIAELHSTRHVKKDVYGWHEDNYIGLNPQSNLYCQAWDRFWCEQRIQPQLDMAFRNGFATQLKPIQTKLLDSIRQQLQAHLPEPVLLHGDLWSGNKGFKSNGVPIIFDPASYYGDREVDIAMTELFGGFGPDFYRAYYSIHPKKPGYTRRKVIYNLYHMLNHLNLFGESYLRQCLHYAKEIMH